MRDYPIASEYAGKNGGPWCYSPGAKVYIPTRADVLGHTYHLNLNSSEVRFGVNRYLDEKDINDMKFVFPTGQVIQTEPGCLARSFRPPIQS